MTVLAISDLHCPFQHPRALNFLKGLKEAHKPQEVVIIGDLVDNHQLSTFAKGPTAHSTVVELEQSRAFIKQLAKVFPKAKVCTGNHDRRYELRAAEVGLSGHYLKPFNEIVGAPDGWEFGEQFQIDGTLFIHGDGYTGLNACQNVIKSKFCNVVFGHTHQAGIQYLNGLWSMNVGCLIDPEAYSFQCAKFFKNKPAIGSGIVKDGVPQFLPLKSL